MGYNWKTSFPVLSKGGVFKGGLTWLNTWLVNRLSLFERFLHWQVEWAATGHFSFTGAAGTGGSGGASAYADKAIQSIDTNATLDSLTFLPSFTNGTIDVPASVEAQLVMVKGGQETALTAWTNLSTTGPTAFTFTVSAITASASSPAVLAFRIADADAVATAGSAVLSYIRTSGE